jgi:hypothetical protein
MAEEPIDRHYPLLTSAVTLRALDSLREAGFRPRASPGATQARYGSAPPIFE